MRRKILVIFSLAAILGIGAAYRGYVRLSPRVDIPIIVYHNLRVGGDTTARQELFVTSELFGRQLQYLKENGYRSSSFEELIQHRDKRKPLPQKSVIISFDDSWKNQYALAFPILKKYGFSATFFISTYVVGQPGFLDWNEIKEMGEAGMEIGGHSKSHLHLATVLDEKILEEEIIEDKKGLEIKIGKEIISFSYPYGEYNSQIIKMVKKAGYKIARGVEVQEKDRGNLLTLEGTIITEDFNSFVAALNSVDFAKERRNWQEKIKNLGGKTAYREFKKIYVDKEIELQHKMAHIFGEALWEVSGLDGISVCDNAFIFGCYHSFFGKAIKQNGLGTLKKLDHECSKRGSGRLGCHHGIGHAIIAYLGDDRLVEALDACATLSWKRLVGGCTGGLFMEYNFRNAAHGTPNQEYVRPLKNDPFEPCSRLPQKFLPACFYEQPDWWSKVFEGNFKKIGELCLEAKEKRLREFCFIGTGRILAQVVEFDVKETQKSCDKDMPSPETALLCRAGGFLSILDYTLNQDVAKSVCNDLAEAGRRLCLQKANLFGTAL